MDTQENGNASSSAIGAQTAPAELNPGVVHDAARQMQESVSRFSQEDEACQETVVTAIRQVIGQLRETDAKVRQNRAEIEKLGSHIRNSRG